MVEPGAPATLAQHAQQGLGHEAAKADFWLAAQQKMQLFLCWLHYCSCFIRGWQGCFLYMQSVAAHGLHALMASHLPQAESEGKV
jgi:hypothetical protein